MPRGIENRVAIDMVVGNIQRTLLEKSKKHQAHLQKLGRQVQDEPLSSNVLLMKQTRQITAMNTIIQNPMTDDVDFNFYFDRLATLLIERQKIHRNLCSPSLLTASLGRWIIGTSMRQRCGHRREANIMGFIPMVR